jgi:hypothetical protein
MPHAQPEALPLRAGNSRVADSSLAGARAPSIPHALLLAATPELVDPEQPEDREHVPALAHALALERPVRAASADHPVQAELHLRAAKLPRVRHAHHPEAAVDARSTPRPKKAR